MKPIIRHTVIFKDVNTFSNTLAKSLETLKKKKKRSRSLNLLLWGTPVNILLSLYARER